MRFARGSTPQLTLLSRCRLYLGSVTTQVRRASPRQRIEAEATEHVRRGHHLHLRLRKRRGHDCQMPSR